MYDSTIYSMSEVSKHNTAESCWIIAHGNVYDATDYIKHHPGGRFVLTSKAGTDVTLHFDYHRKHSHKIWEKYKIGTLENTSSSICVCS